MFHRWTIRPISSNKSSITLTWRSLMGPRAPSSLKSKSSPSFNLSKTRLRPRKLIIWFSRGQTTNLFKSRYNFLQRWRSMKNTNRLWLKITKWWPLIIMTLFWTKHSWRTTKYTKIKWNRSTGLSGTQWGACMTTTFENWSLMERSHTSFITTGSILHQVSKGL